MLQVALDGFCRQVTTVFTSSLRTVCSVNLASIEQSTYSEYVDSLENSTYLTIFSAEPLLSKCVLEIPLAAVMTAVDHMLGGPGRQDQPDRPLTEIESSVARGLVERLLRELRYSLASVVAFEPVITGVEYSPQFAQVAGASDVMVAMGIDLKLNERPFTMTMCMPFSGLLPHLIRAAAPAPVSERERAQRARAAVELKDQFQTVPVDVAVRLRPTTLSPSEIAALQPGDAVRLSHPVLCAARGRGRRHHVRPRHRRDQRVPPRRPDRRHPQGDSMTVPPATTPDAAALAHEAASAGAALLPSAEPLTVGNDRRRRPAGRRPLRCRGHRRSRRSGPRADRGPRGPGARRRAGLEPDRRARSGCGAPAHHRRRRRVRCTAARVPRGESTGTPLPARSPRRSRSRSCTPPRSPRRS